MIGEESLNLLAELSFTTTFRSEKSCSLLRLPLQGGVKELLNTLPGLRPHRPLSLCS
jgi:hypothetical protein